MVDRTDIAARLATSQAVLTQEANTARESLPALMRGVIAAAQQIGVGRAATLVEANQQLLAAALLARSDADAAIGVMLKSGRGTEATENLATIAGHAQERLAALHDETRQAEAHLVRLRKNVAQTELTVSGNHVAQLVQVNEALVCSAIKAQVAADDCEATLHDVSHAAGHDSLTSLPNRARFREHLQQAISHARRHGECFALMFLDLDEFKQINDQLGHAVGDETLVKVAKRITRSIREVDIVSRHGGDEFLILITDVAQVADAVDVANKLIARLVAPSWIDAQVLHIRASIGISMFPADGVDPDTLIDRADAAMYLAKRRGRGCFAFSSEAPAERQRIDAPPPSSAASSASSASNVETDGHHGDLREANGHLVQAAIAAQERQSNAERAQQQQIHFLAVLAHELRAPLTPIRMAAAMLESQPQLQAVIERQVVHITRLVSDLVDVSRINAGKMRLERSEVDIKAIIQSALEVYQPMIDQRAQRLALTLPDHDVRALGDAVRLRQVLMNLLDNASKYTPVDGDLRLDLTSDETSLRIVVSDSGIGIEAEALPAIFAPFMQHPLAVEFNGAGLGIGLAVVRELIEAHGGTVIATSAGSGRGSEFSITLPMIG